MTDRYIDLQVNGFAGVDFNHAGLTPDMLHDACATLRETGIAGALATIITADLAHMQHQLRAITTMHERDALVREVIWGFHVEGPFINSAPGYVGAHPAQAVRPALVDEMKRLLEAAGGLARIVTLAPECDAEFAVTRYLAQHGVCVAAGHCDPTIEQLDAAIDAGLSMFTHLGNGCPMHMHRHDNIIQRVLSRADRLCISFIADGAHVPFAALGNYLRVAGLERTVIVTDAIAAAGLGPGRYTLGDQSVVIGDDLVSWSANRSHFVGSAATMPRVVENLRKYLQLTEIQIKRLVCDNPARLLKTKHN